MRRSYVEKAIVIKKCIVVVVGNLNGREYYEAILGVGYCGKNCLMCEEHWKFCPTLRSLIMLLN